MLIISGREAEMSASDEDEVSNARHHAKNKETSVRLLEQYLERTSEPRRREEILAKLKVRRQEMDLAIEGYKSAVQKKLRRK